MRTFTFSSLLVFAFINLACTEAPKNVGMPIRQLSPTPLPSPSIPTNGDYQSQGRVTRIDVRGGSVEVDHEEIAGVAAAMKTEYLVSDKTMLSGLKLGDTVDFTLRYNNGQATIVNISRIK